MGSAPFAIAPARADRRVELLESLPGVAAILGLGFAVEIGELSRLAFARQLVGYSGLTPSVWRSGASSRSGRLCKAGSASLRWAAVAAARPGWRGSKPWHRRYRDVERRSGKTTAAQSALARKLPIAAWHLLSRQEPSSLRAREAAALSRQAPRGPLAAQWPRRELRRRDGSDRHVVRSQAPKAD